MDSADLRWGVLSLPTQYSAIRVLHFLYELMTWIPCPLFSPTGFKIHRFFPPDEKPFPFWFIYPKWDIGIWISPTFPGSTKFLTWTIFLVFSYSFMSGLATNTSISVSDLSKDFSIFKGFLIWRYSWLYSCSAPFSETKIWELPYCFIWDRSAVLKLSSSLKTCLN